MAVRIFEAVEERIDNAMSRVFSGCVEAPDEVGGDFGLARHTKIDRVGMLQGLGVCYRKDC